ncbi:2959_t:CDS:2 [Acaulospora colombiana]|uniref:2959_t:CDS:1 n=1 Tax=Acaulospora colombiana TaxID=27376 RepID=A0ACA9K2P1_9GLOM|nr:2959_t:CDS:2 [Acaulospora colombiana]
MEEIGYPEQEIYHEKQRFWFCGQLQKEAFNKTKLDNIALKLVENTDSEAKTWQYQFVNPHKNVLGFGNYDINVLDVALREFDLDVQWFDARKVIQFTDSTLFGIILNVPITRFLFWKSHHWITVKPIYGDDADEETVIYNLDSKLSKPVKFDSVDQVYRFLEDIVYHKDGQLILVKSRPKFIDSDFEP